MGLYSFLSEPRFTGLVDLQDYESDVSKYHWWNRLNLMLARMGQSGEKPVLPVNARGAINCATTNAFYLIVKIIIIYTIR